MHVCICMYVCLHVYVCLYVHICMSARKRAADAAIVTDHPHLCVCACMYACKSMHARMCVCIYVHVCHENALLNVVDHPHLFVRTCMYILMYVCICMYVCIYVYMCMSVSEVLDLLLMPQQSLIIHIRLFAISCLCIYTIRTHSVRSRCTFTTHT